MLNLTGTIRTRTPEQTLAKVQPWLKEKFGITRVANITGLDNIGLPVYTAIRPNSKSLSVSQGKGFSPELAQVSAIMEAIEIWHAETITNQAVLGSFSKLVAQHPVIEPQAFVLPEAVTTINDTPLNWVPCLELMSQTQVYLPEPIFLLDTTNVTETNLVFAPSSNGLASGNDRDEAICHGLCELIERDAVARWFELTEEQQDRTLLQLDKITPSKPRELIQQILDAGLHVYIWDVTSPIDVPSFYCAVSDNRRQPYTLFSGSGTHFNSEIALLRAITEAAQARLTYISGSRDDIFPDYYREFDPTPAVDELVNTQPQLEYVERPALKFANFADVNRYLLQQLQQGGVTQIFLYDHTRADLQIPVIHVVTPQLLRATE